MGGGICSASTTMFNAAARARPPDRRAACALLLHRPLPGRSGRHGLLQRQHDLGPALDQRHAVPDRDPVLDRRHLSQRTIYVQLWSLPTGRSRPSRRTRASRPTSSRPRTPPSTSPPCRPATRPVSLRVPDERFQHRRTRTVKDATGAVIHTDTWFSHYGVVNGLLAYKGTPPPPKTPTPTPGPPTPTPPTQPPATPPPATPAPTATPGPSPADLPPAAGPAGAGLAAAEALRK